MSELVRCANYDSLGRALLDAVIGDDDRRVRELLQQGASPNYTEDEDGVRPLHFAALYNALTVVPSLVLAGGDLMAPTECDDTPIAVARRHNHNEMLRLMLCFSSPTHQSQ